MLPPPLVRRIAALVLTVAISATPSASGSAGDSALWSWPTPAPHALARPFIAPATPYAAGHRGIDIRASAGDEVRAPADGVVHFAGYVVDRPLLSIRHAGGVLSSFEPVEPLVEAGDIVYAGEVVGILLPGHCATPCLHLGARIAGGYVNPLLFLGGLDHAILYPLPDD